MTCTIRAHFDGKVIVPDEPVDLPANQPLTIHVQEQPLTELSIEEKRAALRAFISMAKPANIPLEALRRENLYEDR